MRDQRNSKKGLLFEAKRDLCESRFGSKCAYFLRKRVLLDSIKMHLGVIFQAPPNIKNACLGVNWGQNCVKFSFRGYFCWSVFLMSIIIIEVNQKQLQFLVAFS